MSDQRCEKCGGTLYSDPKYGCTSLSCSKVVHDFHYDLTKPSQPTDTDTADYTPQQDCKIEIDFGPWLTGTDGTPPFSRVLPDFHFTLTQQDCKTEIDAVPWLTGADDAPAPLPTEEQIAILLKENEELRERLKRMAVPLHTGNFLWAIPTN